MQTADTKLYTLSIPLSLALSVSDLWRSSRNWRVTVTVKNTLTVRFVP